MFFHLTFCPIRRFSIRCFVPFGVFSIWHFFHSMFCPIRPFVPFDVSSIRRFVPFGIFSIRCFVPFGVLAFDVLSFDVVSIRRLWLQHFVGESTKLLRYFYIYLNPFNKLFLKSEARIPLPPPPPSEMTLHEWKYLFSVLEKDPLWPKVTHQWTPPGSFYRMLFSILYSSKYRSEPCGWNCTCAKRSNTNALNEFLIFQ